MIVQLLPPIIIVLDRVSQEYDQLKRHRHRQNRSMMPDMTYKSLRHDLLRVIAAFGIVKELLPGRMECPEINRPIFSQMEPYRLRVRNKLRLIKIIAAKRALSTQTCIKLKYNRK